MVGAVSRDEWAAEVAGVFLARDDGECAAAGDWGTGLSPKGSSGDAIRGWWALDADGRLTDIETEETASQDGGLQQWSTGIRRAGDEGRRHRSVRDRIRSTELRKGRRGGGDSIVAGGAS